MSDVFASLCRYMPEWMARRGVAVLDSLAPAVRPWVDDRAQQVEAFPGPPDRKAWRGEIVQRFGAGQEASSHEALVHALRSAVLLVAIQQMPPPEVVPGEEASVPTDTNTKKMDRVALKRSRILGMIETGLHAMGEDASALLARLGHP